LLLTTGFAELPAAQWSLSDVAGNIARDSQGHWHGWYRGGVTRGKQGRPGTGWDGAIELDGESGHILVPHRDDMLVDSGAVSLWIRATDRVRTQGLLSKDAHGFEDGGHLTVRIERQRIVARIQSKTETVEIESAEIQVNQWTHVTVSFGPSGFQLYVDGIPSRADYMGGLGSSSGGSGNREPLVIGASRVYSKSNSAGPLQDYFCGRIDDVNWHSAELSFEEAFKLQERSVDYYRDVAEAIMLHDPIAWWPLQEAGGAKTAIDMVGDQHGEYHVNGDQRFDGDDHVNLKTIDVNGGRLTALAWLRPDSFEVQDARIISKATGTDAKDHYWMLSTMRNGDYHVLRARVRTLEKGTVELLGYRPLPASEWTMASVTYDGHFVRLYQDDELVAEEAWTGELSTNSHSQVWIGDNPSDKGDRPFRGQIEHVALFSRALEADEVNALFRARSPKPLPSANQADVKPAPRPLDPPPLAAPPQSEFPLFVPNVMPPTAPLVQGREIWVERTILEQCYCEQCGDYHSQPVRQFVRELSPWNGIPLPSPPVYEQH
jgi:hypothetical protein